MTDRRTLDALDRLTEVLDELAMHARAVALDAHEDDRVALLEGITTVEVGAQHLHREIDRAADQVTDAGR